MKKNYDLTLAQQFSSNSCCYEPNNPFHDDDVVLDASDAIAHIYYRKFIRAMRLKLYA